MTSFHCDLRRTFAVAALGGGALLIAACGSTASPAAAAPTKTVTVPASQPASTAPATPTTSASPTPAGPPPCPTSALKSALGTGNGAAGSTYYPLEFTNVTGAACTLLGYPGVSFVTGVGGSQIGGAASRNPAVASKLVTLAPGSTAHATLQVVNATNYPGAECHLVTAHTMKIFPPNQSAPIYLSFTAPTCSGHAKAVHILAVEAMQSGNGGG